MRKTYFMLLICSLFIGVTQQAAFATEPFTAVSCEGRYPGHLQGFCTDNRDSVFWSFTTVLVKTDREGKILKKIPVGSHHGDVCYHAGKIYVAVNFGQFNNAKGLADSWVYVYDAKSLKELARHKTPELFHGAGGMAYHKGRFIVVGGLPAGVPENYAYEYDEKFQFLKKNVIRSGNTLMGIQTAAFADGHWWFGCYGGKLLKVDTKFQMVGKYDFDCGLGILGRGKGTFLIARGKRLKGKGHDGEIVTADAHPEKGMVIRAVR